MEFGKFDVDGGHLVGDDDATGVLARIVFAAHREAGFGGGGGDQLDNHPTADQGPGAPILADEGRRAGARSPGIRLRRRDQTTAPLIKVGRDG